MTLSREVQALLEELQMEPRWQLLISYLESQAPTLQPWAHKKERMGREAHERWIYESGQLARQLQIMKILRGEE